MFLLVPAYPGCPGSKAVKRSLLLLLLLYGQLFELSVFRWYFALLSISGLFSVTFSVVFAYVADVTTEEDRSAAYGLVCGCTSSTHAGY